jgi:hypothetical protein
VSANANLDRLSSDLGAEMMLCDPNETGDPENPQSRPIPKKPEPFEDEGEDDTVEEAVSRFHKSKGTA